MKDNEYKCDACGNIYEKGRSDEEAENEVKEIWGEIPQEQRAVICDDCFNKRSSAEIKEMGNEYKTIKQKDLSECCKAPILKGHKFMGDNFLYCKFCHSKLATIKEKWN